MICDTPGLAEAIVDLPKLKLDYLTYAVGKHREGIEALLADADGYLKELREINAEVQAERTSKDGAIEQFKTASACRSASTSRIGPAHHRWKQARHRIHLWGKAG